MSRRASTDRLLGDVDINPDCEQYSSSADINTFNAVLGNPERRRKIERRLLWKLDLRLSFLILVSLMNFIDRTNIASARLQGFEDDLKLTGHQFNTLISIVYVGYFFMQIPSNMILDQLPRPSAYLSCCALLWGLLSIGTGVARSFDTALIYRLFLGFTEAGYFPGVLLMLSRWYKRDELGLRMAYFNCSVAANYFLGPLFASGVFSTMDKKLGYPAWRWLFFVEGGLTCIIAVASFYITPDYPTTPASWLTMDEQMLAQRRIVEDLCTAEQKNVQRSGLVDALTDWTVWWLAIAGCFILFGMTFALFFPTIAATMGYSPTMTLLFCAPPWVIGVTTSLLIMRHSDATRDRFWHIAGPVSMGIVGFTIAVSTMNTSIRYLSLFFMAQAQVSYMVVMAWVSNSMLESSSKRAVALAFVNMIGTLGQMGGSYLWLAEWGPSYSKSFTCCILAFSISLVMLFVYRRHLIRLNEGAKIKERSLGLPEGFRYIT